MGVGFGGVSNFGYTSGSASGVKGQDGVGGGGVIATAGGGGGGALPLDGITASFASSIDRLYTSWTDDLMTIRRSGDNAEVDVAPDGSNTLSMDSAVTVVVGSSSATNLGEFVAASGYSNPDSLGAAANGFISGWYDQSGNARHLTQAVAAEQLQIITSGAFETAGSRPAAKFVSTDSLDFPAGFAQAASATVYGVVDTTAIGNSYRGWLERTPSNPNYLVLLLCGNSNRRPSVFWGGDQATWTADVQTHALIRWRYGASLTGIRVAGGAEVTDTVVGTALGDWAFLGGFSGQAPDGAFAQELIMLDGYATAETDSQINASINTRYGLTVP